MSSTYRCEFMFAVERCSVKSPDGIAAFKDGFWLNSIRELTKGSDATFWIPPSAIVYIVKDGE